MAENLGQSGASFSLSVGGEIEVGGGQNFTTTAGSAAADSATAVPTRTAAFSPNALASASDCPGPVQDIQDKEPRKLKTVEKRIFKVIVIGDSNVGKTCLTFRFCEGKFPKKVEATIGVDFREKGVVIGDEEIKLQLWDTAGQERFRKSMVPHYYRNVHAVVFVYDMTKRSTFLNLGQWVAECDRFDLSSAVPRILIGNKCDMPDQIQVPTHEAQRFADTHHMPLFETSARADDKNDHVEAIFMTLAHKLKTSQPLMSQLAHGSFSQSASRSSAYGSSTIRVQHYDTIGQDSGDGCRC